MLLFELHKSMEKASTKNCHMTRTLAQRSMKHYEMFLRSRLSDVGVMPRYEAKYLSGTR
jgi:hypothetical protein